MGINQLIQTGRRSLLTLQAAMNAVGQNIANADTEGYSRRRVVMAADSVASPGLIMRTPYGTAIGTGVKVQSYERLRDGLLAASAAEARTALESSREEQRLLGALEGIFPVGDGSVDSLLGDFWDAWGSLADHPTDTGVRLALRTKAASLATALNHTDRALTQFQSGTEEVLATGIDEINEKLREIAEINQSAEALRLQGTPDLVAEDRRDQLVKELADFMPVRVREDGSAGYTLSVNGMAVVQGSHVTELELDTSGGTPTVRFADTNVAFTPAAGDDGRLGAWLRTLTDTLPATRTALDELASTLVTEVNALHQAGYGLDGATGRDFFDPARLTAGEIRLSDDVRADPGAIAASGDATALGDSTVALDIAALRTQPLLNGGTETAETFSANLVAGIGGKVQQASQKAGAQTAMLDHLSGLEQGVSAVSLDEEMTRLIQYQQAFAASARVIDTAQQMMDTLLAL